MKKMYHDLRGGAKPFTAGQLAALQFDVVAYYYAGPRPQMWRANAAGERPQSYNQIIRGLRPCSVWKVDEWVRRWNERYPAHKMGLDGSEIIPLVLSQIWGGE